MLDKEHLERAESILLLGAVWAGLGACIISALVYDVTFWLSY